MNTRRLAVLLAVVVMQSAALAGGAPRQTEAPAWLTRLSTWIELVAAHRPGAFDTPARLVAFWPEAHMDEVRTDFVALAALYRRELIRSARPAPVVYRDTMIPVPDLGRLLGLAEAEGAPERANRVLKRAAILYADVVMLVVPLLPGQFGCSAGASMLVKDGTRIGTGCVNLHWLQGRALLDAVRPDPAKDETVRLWYAATLTFLLQTGNFANARPQFEHARMLFRLDPDILFQGGYYHEAFASPLVQTAAVAAGSDLRGGKAHLEDAEDLFRRAVREDPRFVEARVRHGRVLALLGRRQDAARELRLAVAAAEGPQLRYYAELFLGQAEESVDNLAAARDHYLRAAALYPQAQSPLLALALLARQSGDGSGVGEAMAKLLALPFARRDDSDPWWVYSRWQNERYEARLAELYAALQEGDGDATDVGGRVAFHLPAGRTGEGHPRTNGNGSDRTRVRPAVGDRR